MSQLIYIDVNEVRFARIRFEFSSTAAQLRIVLAQTHTLSSNTYFLDTRGYRVTKEDEQAEIIQELLHENNVIKMRNEESISTENTQSNTSYSKRQGSELVNKFIESATTELFSITGWLWCLLLKPLIIVTFMGLLLYFGYTKFVCHHTRFVPFVSMFCPAEHVDHISLPPVSKLAENSVSLADSLMNADISAPMRFVRVKTSLIELRNQVIYSNIDASVKNKLGEQMLELQHLVQIGADQLTIMLGSFGGALDKLRIYTQFALEDLSEVINPRIRRPKNPLQTGYSEMEVRDKLIKSFEDYLTSLSGQIDEILFKAQETSASLESIKNKLETIQELNFKGKYISQNRIDELKHGSFWSWLFDEGKLGIAKHERSLEILNSFTNFILLASNNVNDVIIKLKTFKSNAENLKETGIQLEELLHISINRHAQLLTAALKRLTDSKEKFEGRIQQANQRN